ncbi:BURP domain-containing protein 3-like protein [Carex littledalei]|uniref:BURP domain-containing protein 3-like protein n=1 Tax=Carex littledalei TaxID=544730 RepID=A0A833VBA0_9POAL|nr:BURP domain-containing protein 3-like protein [Carex littledalei]
MARFLLLLSFLLVALVFGVSDADSPAEVYWRSVLPNTPMPSVLRDLIYSNEALPAATEESVGSFYFSGKSLRIGSTMTLHFTRATAGASLLPRQVADSIPFSSSKLPNILSRLSIDPSSEMASSIKKTLAECEANAMPGEIKHCATSLESMVDFAMSSLKSRNLRALSTFVSKDTTPNQKYTITGLNKVKASGLMACHAQRYPYAVFRCHTTTSTVYTVSLIGADGSKVIGKVPVHIIDPDHPSEGYRKKRGVVPDNEPIFHILPQDDIIWARV